MTDAARPLLLLVDDEEEILVALTDLFEDAYDVISSSSPVVALQMLADRPGVAVIVSDQRMPQMPGNQFLARARGVSDAEAILLTGYADLSAVVSAVNEGAIGGYASKPWDPDALRAMVGAAAERHALRRALAFERAAFLGLSEGTPDRVSIVAPDGATVRRNAPAAAWPGTADADADARDAAALAGGDHSDEEHATVGVDGEERWTRVRRIPFDTGADGRHLLKIESDETEHRLASRRLHQSEKLEALGTLAGGIAHDFNNLLAAIVGNLELATRRIDDPDRLPRYLAAAGEAAQRGATITRRLLSFSRQRDLAAETFRPDRAIEDVEELIVRTAAGRVTLRYAFDDPTWSVRTDPGQFELAIVNLCINARDAMAGEGEIVLATANIDDATAYVPGLSGPHVRVSVSDTGSGISDAVRARVFEPFFTTKAQGVGTGLGLPMVRAMAHAAGGDVTLDSVVGEGSTVSLWLPRAPDAAEVTPETTPAQVASLRILVAEDDAEVRAVLCEHLVAAGHAVEAHVSGEAALAALRGGARYDLLVTDYAMPRVSGVELARRARAEQPDLPALLVTGFAELKDGAVTLPVLTKPFTARQLDTALATAMAVTPTDPA